MRPRKASTMKTTSTPQAYLPDEIADLVILPLQAESVAIQAAGLVRVGDARNGWRVPIVVRDAAAAWTAEGAEITPSTPQLTEVGDVWHKLSALTAVSRELMMDSDPNVARLVGEGMARDLARKLDVAFFGARGTNTLAPAGLGDLDEANEIPAGAAWASIDPFIAAVYAAADVGAQLSAWVANPSDAVQLATLKRQADSLEPLLNNDPTAPARQQIQGVPMLTSPAVTRGVVWGIPGAGRVAIGVREDATVETDSSVYFASDQVAIRGTLRVTYLYPHQQAVQKIALTTAP